MDSKKIALVILAILLVGAMLRIWNLDGPDMITDDALYALRAVGYFDYLGSLDTQTTPAVWFSEPQWWQKLSFHDAPPLVFLVEHVFFKLFGDSITVARLPVVLFGLLSILGIFLLGRLIGGDSVGLMAAALMAVLNYHIWISRIGFLDGFLLPPIIFSIYFFIKAKDKPLNYLWWFTALAAGFLTKYTFIFLLPAFGIIAFLYRRSIFKEKWFYLGLAVFFLLLSPLIIYNIMVWKTRGHFDAALSTMVGIESIDFQILKQRHIKTELSGVWGVIRTVASKLSLGMRVILSFALIYFSYLTIKKRKENPNLTLIFLAILSGLLVLTLVGGSDRFNVILIPLLTIVFGIACKFLWDRAQNYRSILIGALIISALWEMLFTVQNQLIPTPFIENRFFYDARKPVWWGYNNLDRYVENFYADNPNRNYILFSITPQLKEYKTKIIQSFYEDGEKPQQEHLLVFDDRLEWFATTWIVERRRLYEAQAMPTLTNLIEAIDGNYVDKFLEFGFKDVYAIILTGKNAHETILNTERITDFLKILETNYEPVDHIKNDLGETAFLVYYLPLDSRLNIFKQ